MTPGRLRLVAARSSQLLQKFSESICIAGSDDRVVPFPAFVADGDDDPRQWVFDPTHAQPYEFQRFDEAGSSSPPSSYEASHSLMMPAAAGGNSAAPVCRNGP
jgi:hypothetical protein